MIALRMVRLIEAHSEELAWGLLQKLQTSPCARDFQKVPPEELRQRTVEIYKNLTHWLLNKSEAEIQKTYTEIGRRRRSQGVSCSNLLWAITATKEHLWDFMESERVDRELDLYGELDLLRRIDRFFDRALYYAATAYEESAQAAAGKP
jgi:hypothetical protein